jgi:hypothetical protein
MKKIFVSCLLGVLATSSLAQQKETFDLATYTVPQGWKKIEGGNGVTGYAITNNLKGTYCQIAIYKSMGTMGNAQLDFDTEWNDLIVKPYKPTANPEMVPGVTEDGWDAKAGVAPFDYSGGKSIAMLVTMSGYATRMSLVVLTNTEDYQTEIENFLGSVDLKKPETSTQTTTGNSLPVLESKKQEQPIVQAKASGNFAFNTTNFDDGWVATEQEDWAQATKGNIRVLIHYPNKNADAYNSNLLDGLKNAWNVLVAPRYSSASNFEFKPISSWQSIEFAEADAVEKTTGKSVHVVLFKMNYSNGSGRYLEFITPDKESFEQEFGAYHETSYGWEKVESMATYNKFAVAVSDLKGKWTSDFSGMVQYVNAYTGADAGANTHASNESFEFMAGNTYKWDIGVASGMVGNIKFQSAKSNGKFSMPNSWQINFSDLEGKPKTYNAFFSCIKGARILWFEDAAYPTGFKSYGKVE